MGRLGWAGGAQPSRGEVGRALVGSDVCNVFVLLL